jgi:hypothetical protein
MAQHARRMADKRDGLAGGKKDLIILIELLSSATGVGPDSGGGRERLPVSL